MSRFGTPGLRSPHRFRVQPWMQRVLRGDHAGLPASKHGCRHRQRQARDVGQAGMAPDAPRERYAVAALAQAVPAGHATLRLRIHPQDARQARQVRNCPSVSDAGSGGAIFVLCVGNAVRRGWSIANAYPPIGSLRATASSARLRGIGRRYWIVDAAHQHLRGENGKR